MYILVLVVMVTGLTSAMAGLANLASAAPAGRAVPATEPMQLLFKQAVTWVIAGIEAAGIAVMLLGILIATGVFVRRTIANDSRAEPLADYRANLGRAILVGLEFLIAADIIGTVAIERTWESVGVLGAVVLIRTFLSIALDVEIEGRWPWHARGTSRPTESSRAES